MKPSPQQKAEMIRKINEIEPFQKLNPDTAVIETQNIPFYPQGALIKCILGPYDALWYVNLPKETVPLDGSIANIHHLNFITHLNLTPDMLPAYLKFRLYFGMEDGRRRLVTKITSDASMTYTAQIDEAMESYRATFKISPRGETSLLEKEQGITRISPFKIPSFKF